MLLLDVRRFSQRRLLTLWALTLPDSDGDAYSVWKFLGQRFPSCFDLRRGHVISMVRDLEKAGWVIAAGEVMGSRGRPKQTWRVTAEGRRYLEEEALPDLVREWTRTARESKAYPDTQRSRSLPNPGLVRFVDGLVFAAAHSPGDVPAMIHARLHQLSRELERLDDLLRPMREQGADSDPVTRGAATWIPRLREALQDQLRLERRVVEAWLDDEVRRRTS